MREQVGVKSSILRFYLNALCCSARVSEPQSHLLFGGVPGAEPRIGRRPADAMLAEAAR